MFQNVGPSCSDCPDLQGSTNNVSTSEQPQPPSLPSEFEFDPANPNFPICSDTTRKSMKMCSVPGQLGYPSEIPCHAVFDAEDEKPVKDYLGRFNALIQCSPCGQAKSSWNPIYERSYQRKTFDPRREPCLQQITCIDDTPKEIFGPPEPVPEVKTYGASPANQRRSCNQEFCCRPLVASRLNLTCTQSPTRGCLPPKAYTFSATSANCCPPPCGYMYPKIPNKPVTILLQCCEPRKRVPRPFNGVI